ncbi:hypothetical protein ES703_103510 [subsurface metagenome]
MALVNNTVGYLCRTFNDKLSVLRFDNTTVTNLPTRLGVETGFVKDDARLGICSDLFWTFEAFGVNCTYYCTITLTILIFAKIISRRQFGSSHIYHLHNILLRCPCTLSLLFHQFVKFSGIDFEVTFLSHKLGQIKRKAIGIVKLEGIFAVDGSFAGLLRPPGSGIEDFNTSIECSAKACLFRFDYH